MQQDLQVQQELHAKVVELLQAATAESDAGQRIRLLQEAQEILLRSEAQAETVGSCLDYFLNLRTDPHTALRRYAAYFLKRVIFFKPSLALRCIPAVVTLLKDADSSVAELAMKAAISLHGRALFLLALEHDSSQFQHHSEQLRLVYDAMKNFLAGGCPNQLPFFRLAARWAKVLILSQTTSPLILRIRVPTELRGVSCLQDFPETVTPHLDLVDIQKQAEEMFDFVRNLMDRPPSGCWHPLYFHALLQCIGSVVRQRPLFLHAALEDMCGLLREASAVLDDGEASKRPLPVADANIPELRRLVWGEVQLLLASNLTAAKRGEFTELLCNTGLPGSLEDLATQAKYQQLCASMESSAEGSCEPKAKRPRKGELKKVWVGNDDGILADEDAFDGDALFSGEAEILCRRFEDYFGLPSQREPAGHVPGPALLASRIGSNAELARIALTSLNSLSLKRSLLRDRAHERVVVFNEPPLREHGTRQRSGAKTDGDAADLVASFLSDSPAPAGEEAQGGDTATGRDPRGGQAAKQRDRQGGRGGLGDSANGRGGAGDSANGEELLPIEGNAARLPNEPAARNHLQLQLFSEVLEAQRRMDKSLMRASLSQKQLSTFDFLSRQVALHLVAGIRTAVSPTLQRSMCKVFMLNAFDSLRSSTDTKLAAPANGTAALGRLVELFYAKFTTDVARWQDQHGHVNKPAAVTAARTPLREILETARGGERRCFTYNELFGMFVAEFERRGIHRRELRAFLNEIPFVPTSAFHMLEAQCKEASARKMALLTVLSLIENKPSCRWHGLHMLFKLAYSGGDDSSVRFDTIRLIINKIYSATPQPPTRWQLPHLSDEEAKALLGDKPDDSGAALEVPDDDFIPLQRLRGRCVEDVATLMLRSMAPWSAEYALAVKVSLRVEQLRGDLFKGTVCASKDRVWLYLALCIKRPVLLHELVETFTKCDADMKEHLINSIEEAIKYIPASERELLVLVQKASPETERLVLKVLHILMQTSQGKEGLSTDYGEAVTRLYNVTQNPRLLVPVFDLLDRKHLLDFLPAILQLEAEQVTDAFQQLVRSRNPPLSISELLTELHHMNNPSENIVPIKCSMQALNIIFGMREQFDPKVYGIVIQALVEESGPLPTLFMRTVIQVVKELPRLSDFVVMEILPRLARQEVWGDENMWRGFMIVLQHTFASQSGGAARVLAMLPMSQLEDVLVQHPEWKAQLREFVARQPAGAIPPNVRQLLQ